jgi:8-oxo-dGTP pyrophosphatase MutT (NUDIX family)
MARSRRVVRAFSAGGVVFRRAVGLASSSQGAPSPPADPSTLALSDVEIALVGRLNAGMWMLPKGTPHPGESVAEAAQREVREETGLETQIVGELGSIFYVFARDGTRYRKEVFHYLLEATGGDVSLHDMEYDEARWFPFAEALQQLTFHNEAELLQLAGSLIVRLLAGEPAASSPTAVAGRVDDPAQGSRE